MKSASECDHACPPSPDPRELEGRFDRFSPYQERPETYGIRNLHAHPGYREVYRGLSDELLEDLAYCFIGDYDSKADVPVIPQTPSLQDPYARGP